MADAGATDKTMTLAEWCLLILLSVLWGGSFFFNGVAVQELPSLSIVAVRVGLAAIALWLVMAMRGITMPKGGCVWRAFFVMGLLNNAIPFSLIVWGQASVASGVAAVLNASTPVFTVVFAHFLTNDERMTRARMAGVLLGLAGVAVMLGGMTSGAQGAGLMAPLAILGAAISYALASIYGRRFRAMGVVPMATAAGQVTASSLLLLPLVLVVDRPWAMPVPGASAVAALIGIALLSTALAYIIYFRLLATAGATNLMLVTLLAPVSAVLLGVAFLDEVFLPRHLAGMVLIAAGLAAIDGRVFRQAGRGGSVWRKARL